MNKELYLHIKREYSHVCSWAIWKEIDIHKKPKFGVGDIDFFQDDDNIIKKIKPNIVFVGLNISKKIEKVFGNFHSDNSRANDFKLRYAIQNTCLEGGYMTDIIKDFEEKLSGKVNSYLRKNPDFLKKNIDSFKKELTDIGCIKPIIICFGNDVYNILSKEYKGKKVYKLTHYSARISKESFKKEVQDLVDKIGK